MRINSLYVKKFKNLADFTIDFKDRSLIDVIIGKNGSGKSNFFEVIIETFRWLKEPDSVISFDFKLSYTNNDKEITIEGKNGKLYLDGNVKTKLSSDDLPDNLLIYYAGHNKLISNIVEEYEENYRSKIKGNELKELRLFFGIEDQHKNILLLILLLFDRDSEIRKYLCSRLNISDVDSDIKIVFSKPYYFDSSLSSWDENKFWGIKGYLKDFLFELESKVSQTDELRTEGYLSDNEEFVLYISINSLSELFNKMQPMEFFRYFDDLRAIGMLSEIDFDIKLSNNQIIKLNHFSDGEYQTIFINGLLELFKDRNCLVLLDEPDSFLHPEWQHRLIKNVLEYIPDISNTNHIILTSHCASTIVSSEDERVNLFELHNSKIRSISVSKQYAIHQLSSGMIALNEEKQILSILDKIKIGNKPVLFTEGSTDPQIIENAWTKIRTTPMPFTPIYAFNCTYLRQLIQDEKIYNEANGNPIFALFDFDEAYNEWNYLKEKGEEIESDPFIGLCCKINNKEGYAYLLPVPNIDAIKPQVIKDEANNKTFKHESRLSIELLFYGHDATIDNFEEVDKIGGGKIIQFKGDKDNFAKNIVPDLPKEAFSVFEPFFASIEAKI